MKYTWQDLPERKNLFTVKNTMMINLNTGKPVQHYATNTKIAVVQKCITKDKTYYRTAEAAHHYLNYAFEATALGLPNEKAPSVHSINPNPPCPHSNNSRGSHTNKPAKKQTFIQNTISSKGGEKKWYGGWIKKIFRRKNGKTKDS